MTHTNSNTYKRCYHTHPALPLKDGLVIYGGSCSHPAVSDADVYVGFDYSQGHNNRAYPWTEGVWFNFPITDMKAPADYEAFSQLIDWLILQLSANKKVHLGCIGGHGRTGTVMAALVARFLGEADAIAYVRKHYCQKAVESKAQIDFLIKHFGVLPAETSKTPYTHPSTPSSESQSDLFYERYGSKVPRAPKEKAPTPLVTPGAVPKKTTAKMTLQASFRPSKVAGVPLLWGSGISFGGKVL